MSVETLDSDKVNFLVWRYLRELGYDEAALKLQKEWRLEVDGHDPANLPFARHVKHHALITLLQKGLVSQAYEREIQQADGEESSTLGTFGPLAVPSNHNNNAPSPIAAAAPDEDTLLDEASIEISRKRPHEWQSHQDQSEHTVKRPRLSNGFDDENAMDLDGEHELDDEGQAYPSPAEVERPVTPIMTRGPEEGTQMDEVIELTGSTTFYNLTEDGNEATESILLHCAWNPKDPAILATAGTDALARLWTFSRGSSPAFPETAPHVNGNRNAPHHPFVSLVKTDDPTDLSVAAISWTSDGRTLALAIESRSDNSAKLFMTDIPGEDIQTLGSLEPGITCLRWNPQKNQLLALFNDENEGSSVSLFSAQADGSLARNEIFHSTRDFVGLEERQHQILDALWVSESEFVICGEDVLRSFKCLDNQVLSSTKFDTREDHGIVTMVYDARSQMLATGTYGGIVDVWDLKGQRKSFSAHQGVVTALAWQSPGNQSSVDEESELLLASAGDDSIISIWNVRGSETKPKRCMTMDSAVVALALTPDGAYLTGATTNRILLWKIDDVGLPRACWIRGAEHGWETPKTNGSDSLGDHHSLCWNVSGDKLAYGAASQLAIIDFNR